jgi:beta-lactamase superfamily II metal-dependent hydrolase
MNYSLPNNDEAEITLIGTGGGYGESCVIHLGNQMWAVVDSCINPKTQQSLPLEYLIKLGVDVESNVKLIICTHWHNDHILGMSKLLAASKSSAFSCAKVNDREKFMLWLSMDYQKLTDEKISSSTNEFVECLKIIGTRKLSIMHSYPDRILGKFGNSTISSLSPSDFVIQQFDGEISKLIKDFGIPSRKFVLQKPNDQSVVLLLEFGDHCAVLGADLEYTNNTNKGWLNILNHSQAIIDKKASLFKIPHHGSITGYHENLWLQLLKPNPVAKLTPWNRNKILPSAEMIKKFLGHTKDLFITSPIISNNKPKKRNKNTEKIIDFFNDKISEVKFEKGIIRSRIKLSDSTARWLTELEDSSLKIEV